MEQNDERVKMMYDIRLITGKLNRWGRFMKKYSFPTYNDIPNLGLYMDQVLTLMTQYLAPLTTEGQPDAAITAATINNYVRVKVMPAPEKKKYNRVHIAYLIIICTLKQALSISEIQRLIPTGLSDDEMRTLYNEYARCYKASVLFFINEVRDEADRILNVGNKLLEDHDPGERSKADQSDGTEKMEFSKEEKEEFDYAVKKLIFSSATISNFAKLLTSKLVQLGDVEFTEEAVQDRLI